MAAGVLGDQPAALLVPAQLRIIHDFFDTYVKSEPCDFPAAAAADYAEIAVVHDHAAMLARYG